MPQLKQPQPPLQPTELQQLHRFSKLLKPPPLQLCPSANVCWRAKGVSAHVQRPNSSPHRPFKSNYPRYQWLEKDPLSLHQLLQHLVAILPQE
jgi:hypothetical protein